MFDNLLYEFEVTEKEKELEREKRREKMKEFKDLCKPLNEWLQKNYHPHTIVIIENNGAQILEQKMGIPFEVVE